VDLALYARVLWRFKLIVLLGLLLAGVLAVLSVAKITPHGLRYRKAVVWQSQTNLLLTQQGFPEGRALFPPSQPNKQYPYADTGRFASLTDLYSQFANSDAVKQLMLRDGARADESITAAPVSPVVSSSPLPVIALAGQGTSPSSAIDAVRRGTSAFRTYITQQQRASGISDHDRIDIQVLRAATPAAVLQPRKKTLPIIIFLGVLSATFALAFVLENLRPNVRIVESVASVPPQAAATRRTA
jgi:hypothetical protein